jgi:acyl phosphate:glycerol-3-phosphate acyltransferase
MLDFIAIIIAYLLGSISFAVLICKLTGKADPRTQGSRNAGATNVLRLAGRKLALLTLLGDILKGFVAVMIGKLLGLTDFYIGLVALAAFIGHLYPVYFGFKGGKGVATGLGILFALSAQLGAIVTLTWVFVAVIFRYSSLAAVIAFALAPLFALLFTNSDYALATALMAIIVLFRHRANIKRIIAGIEPKIGKK